jgi:hypothetical protein
MNSSVVSTRGRNRNRTQNIFRSESDSTDKIQSTKKSKSNTIYKKKDKSKRKSNRLGTSSHKSGCIRNWYHVIVKPRDIIKEYNIVLY